MPNVTFNAPSTLSLFWTTFKPIALSKVMSIQYDDDGTVYTIFTFDGTSIVYTCTIWKGTVPTTVASTYSQTQNDSDKSDFETNYKPYANKQINADELDPRLIHKFGNLTSAATTEVLMCASTYTEQASQAQRSVVSTNAQDNPAGTGAAAVRITYLDSNYVLNTEDITLNGTTAVNTVGTTIRFIENFQVIQGSAAVGTISLMTGLAGAGSPIISIPSSTEQAFICHHYVPAGKRAWILGWGATVSNNANFKLKGQYYFNVSNLVDYNLDLENLLISSPNLPEFYRTFQSPLPVPAKTHIRITVVPGQATSTIERSQLDIWEDVT